MSNKKILPQEIIKKIKHIEICTRRLLRGASFGDYTVVQKGFGLEFDQIREYQPGDDVRFIDWKSTARTNKVLLKQYYQERNRIIWLLVDVSLSIQFTSGFVSKHNIIAQITSVLSIVADTRKDLVGLILFSHDIEYCLPPKRGRSHIHEIMKQVFAFEPQHRQTNIQNVLKYLIQKRSKEAIIFLISDFIDEGYEKALPFLTQWYDVIAVRCLDDNERNFPIVGCLCVEDIETGEFLELDIKAQKKLSTIVARHIDDQNATFKKYGIDCLDVNPLQPFVGDLIRFFQKRMMY